MTARSHRRQKCLEYQKRYEQTAKGKAAHQRYGRTAAGKRVAQRTRAKRIQIGTYYVGMAQSADQAQQINAHIKERLSAFKQRFASDPRMETDPADTVPA